MQSFFIALAKNERGWQPSLVADAESRLATELGHDITHRKVVVSRDRRIALLAFTNEPTLSLYEEASGKVAVISGYSSRASELLTAEPSLDLQPQLNQLPGRFSGAVFDPAENLVAVANSTVRVDSIFYGRNSDYSIVGTRASTIASFLSGRADLDVQALLSFISTGFFGCNDTAFQGVTCLPAATTWFVSGGSERRIRRPLAQHARDHGYGAAELAEAFVAAILEMSDESGPIALGLTGGKDSRLIAAAATRAGLTLDCYTQWSGEWCSSDVYVAELVAKELGVPHRLERAASPGGESTSEIDYLNLTAKTLRATDGALWGFDSEDLATSFSGEGRVRGLGGEVLRGGYGEKHKELTRRRAEEVARLQFGRHSHLFTDDARYRYFSFLDDWCSEFSDNAAPHDLLDALYAEFRIGRWVAARSRASALRCRDWMPFADNALAFKLLSIPALAKVDRPLHMQMLEALNPNLVPIPLANEYWPGTPKRDGLRMKETHPQAFRSWRQLARQSDWRRTFPPALVEHMREYCIGQGRIGLLGEVVDIDAAAALLGGERDVYEARQNMKVLHGLYAACVLVSGDWLKAPKIGMPEPLQFSFQTAE